MQKSKQITYGLGGLGVLLGGVGVLLVSERGRELLSKINFHLERAPETIEQFADATQVELDRIQQTLDQIAARLQAVG
jgi:ribose 1,5-bisphosphokinase PhnN